MPERSSKPKRPRDINEPAYAIVQESTRERVDEPGQAPEPMPDVSQKNPHAQALGRLGGLKGGRARAAKLPPEERSEIARKAAQKRWRREGP